MTARRAPRAGESEAVGVEGDAGQLVGEPAEPLQGPAGRRVDDEDLAITRHRQVLAVGRVANDVTGGGASEANAADSASFRASARRADSGSSASTFAPWSIQRRMTAIWSRGIDVLGGICGCLVPSRNWTSRLSAPLPGTNAGPRRPPLRIASTVASDRPEVSNPSS